MVTQCIAVQHHPLTQYPQLQVHEAHLPAKNVYKIFTPRKSEMRSKVQERSFLAAKKQL